MAKKVFKENFFRASSKKIADLEKTVVVSGLSLNRFFSTENLISLSLFFALITLLAVIISYNYLPERIPLFYSRPWGKEQLANKQFFFIIPFLSLFFFLVNSAVAKFLNKNIGKFLSAMMMSVLFLFVLSGFIAVLKIIFLVV